MDFKRWFHDLFQVSKPVIAMAHLPALPGTPRYDRENGVDHIVEWVARDVAHLVAGGVDAIMYCNEDDRPYVFEAGVEQIAAMTRVIAETKPTDIPFGVDFLWDPIAAMAVAHATGGRFIREVLTGVYESDMGLPQRGGTGTQRGRLLTGRRHPRVGEDGRSGGGPIGNRGHQ